MQVACPVLTLGDVCRFVGGGTPARIREDFFAGDIPWVTVKDFKTSRIADAQEHITQEAVDSSAVNVVEPGTVLLVTRVGLGKVAIAERRLAINQDIKGLTPRGDVLPDYLFWFLLSRAPAIERMGVGATVKGVTLQDVRAIRIPIPALDEQHRIIDLLSRAQNIVRMRREAKQKAKEIIPALFLDMFGEIPPSEFVRCGDVCEYITKGTTPKSADITDADTGDRVPFLKVMHITDNGDIDFAPRPSFISQSTHNKSLARSIVYPNDVLMNIVGPPLGRIALIPPTFAQWNVNQALAIFRARPQVLPYFLFHALRSAIVLPSIMQLPVGVRQLNISLEQCRNIRIPLPAIPLQEKFGERMRRVEAFLRFQTCAAQETDQLFGALLANTFGTPL